jgi:signal transduction histidine kinase
MPDDATFPQLVALACHDLRTPLATVYGFARTLASSELEGAPARYVDVIQEASEQIRELLDELTLVTRVELGRYDPAIETADSLELAEEAAGQLEEQRLSVTGEGAPVRVDREATAHALARLARAAARHTGVDEVRYVVRGAELELSPVGEKAGPVLVGEELKELGAVAAATLVRALGGSLALEKDRLRIVLPTG